MSVLCLNNNCLKKLPDDLGNLQGLEKLYIGNQKFSKEGFVLFPVNPNPNIKNTLVTLPDTIGNLKRLIALSAEDIYLKTLPESLVRLSALTTLNLNDNQLTELPKGFGKLPLTTLHLGNNQLKTLPEEFIHLQALTTLNLERNQFTTLPSCLFTLKKLTDLYLNNNQIKMLPDTVKNLKELASLDLSGNVSLSIIPISILIFASQCKIDLEKCGLPTKVVTNLIKFTKNKNYRGPKFSFPAKEDRVLLKKEILFERMTHQLAAIDLKDMKGLANILIKGPWTVEILENVAFSKQLDFYLYDKIKIYYDYLTKSKEEFMSYYEESPLKPEQLAEVKELVLNQHNNLKKRSEFLARHPKWIEALSANYSEQYQKILDKTTRTIEKNGREKGSLEYEEGLIKLTEKVLQIKSI